MTGSIDIQCGCLFRDTNDLFNIIESIKTIDRVDKVSWSEEVRIIPTKETTILSFQESINNSLQTDTNGNSPAERMP